MSLPTRNCPRVRYALMIRHFYLGITYELNYPYTTTDPGSCTYSQYPTVEFTSWHRVPCADVDAIKTAIMTYGVVDAAVYVGSAFQAYSSGVYEDNNDTCNGTPCSYTPTNHAVALVGWDDAAELAGDFGEEDMTEFKHSYDAHWRFFETDERQIEYPGYPWQGRWLVDAVNLPDDVLQKLYRRNAQRLIPQLQGLE